MGRCPKANFIFALFTALAITFIFGCESNVDTVIEPTRVKIIKEIPGYGPKIVNGDLATIKYQVTLPNGKEILNDDEFKFMVNTKQPSVIEGLNSSVIGMRVGGSRTVDCPPHLHWGRRGSGDGDGAVPANTNILLHITILKLDKQ